MRAAAQYERWAYAIAAVHIKMSRTARAEIIIRPIRHSD